MTTLDTAWVRAQFPAFSAFHLGSATLSLAFLGALCGSLARPYGGKLADRFGGAFITEAVFSWNGMGLLAVNAARGNDYPLIMGTVLMFAILTLLGNLIADILYVLLDPRIRYR